MLFNSFGFIFLFLPLVLVGYFSLCRWAPPRAALAFLAVASAVFYGWWNLPYLILIGVLVGFNFAFAHLLTVHRLKWLLALGILANLAVLGYFKYANFFLENVNVLFRQSWTWTNVLLPLGLSFHTFQQIEYIVSVYRGERAERDVVRYSVFVLFFPQLIAGPLVLYREIAGQFNRPRLYNFRLSNFVAGLSIFTAGLAKKVLLADSMASLASPIYQLAGSGAPLSTALAWQAAIAYGLQIYFDFSGYSDMALGLARMFGIRLPINFNSPYKSLSIIDFWRRWHMTLSRFLRDYVYIPLGGNRHGLPRQYLCLLATMLLGGLWHGASWNFILWGGLHGLFLVVNHLWRLLPWKPLRASFLTAFLSGLLTFTAVTIAWVFFRAPDFPTACRMLSAMASFQGGPAPAPGALALLAGGLFLVWFTPNVQQIMGRAFAGLAIYREKAAHRPARILRWRPTMGWGLVVGLLFAISLFAMSRVSEFIYFNF